MSTFLSGLCEGTKATCTLHCSPTGSTQLLKCLGYVGTNFQCDSKKQSPKHDNEAVGLTCAEGRKPAKRAAVAGLALVRLPTFSKSTESCTRQQLLLSSAQQYTSLTPISQRTHLRTVTWAFNIACCTMQL